MAKKQNTKSAARKERRDRRNRKHEVAEILVTNGLMAKTLTPAKLKALLAEYATLSTKALCATCKTPIPKRKGADLCEACSQSDSESR